MITEIVGYLGMVFVLLSIAMKNIRILRFLIVVGAILCCIYGFVTKTYPTAILNLMLILVNLVFPVKYYIHLKKMHPSDAQEINENS